MSSSRIRVLPSASLLGGQLPFSQSYCPKKLQFRTFFLPRQPTTRKEKRLRGLGNSKQHRRASNSSPPKTTTAATESESTPARYPRWLPIYHSGTAPVALASAAKIFAFAFFGVSAAVFAPGFYEAGVKAECDGKSPYWKYFIPAALTMSAAIPFYATTLSSRAMVTYIHIALPPAARQSRAALEAWARRIPRTTHVMLTTQRASLNARQTETCMAELGVPLHGAARGPRGSMGPGGAKSGANLGPASGSGGTIPANVLISMKRQRLPGWQPPTSSGPLAWFSKEPREYLVRPIGNKSKEKMIWGQFLEQIPRM